MNSLIRQYFPKGTAFDEVTPQSIELAQDHLNGRPRRVLDYRTSNGPFFRSRCVRFLRQPTEKMIFLLFERI